MSLRQPFHLVIHDSAWGAAVNWVLANPGRVSSTTFLDSSPAELPAFPFRFNETPVVGDLLLRSQFMFGWLVRLCCSRSADVKDAAEAYRVLLKDDGGKKAAVAAGKGLNYSFNLGQWVASEGLKEVKFQVLWSNTWSDRWIDEGWRIAAALLQAKFAWHSGGRWPQEDAAEEIAGMITQFVLFAKIHETDEGRITARTDTQTESLMKKVAVLTTTTMAMAATMSMLLVISVPMALVRNGGVENVTCCRIVDNGWLCSSDAVSL